MPKHEPLWTLGELANQAARALSFDYPSQANGQVREVPDLRTIRYYTTLGLLDRPREMQGRTALYGRRHLLQLVAIKRLQARGLSLAGIQEQLLGLPTTALARFAKVPPEVLETPPRSKVGGKLQEKTLRSRPEAFWKDVLSPPTSEKAATTSIPRLLSRLQSCEGSEARLPGLFQGIPLRPDVTLVIGGHPGASTDDVHAIRTAARPLLSVLEARGLCSKNREKGDPHE